MSVLDIIHPLGEESGIAAKYGACYGLLDIANCANVFIIRKRERGGSNCVFKIAPHLGEQTPHSKRRR